jgi:hypothetical protein
VSDFAQRARREREREPKTAEMLREARRIAARDLLILLTLRCPQLQRVVPLSQETQDILAEMCFTGEMPWPAAE